MKSWLQIEQDSDFSIYNIPFGIYSINGGPKKVASAIGNQVIDLQACYELGLFDGLNIPAPVWQSPFLNSFIGLGKSITNKVRLRIQSELIDAASILKTATGIFHPMSEVQMHLPIQVGDYTDFYSSLQHATNVGMMFRNQENALFPNWKHLPIAYHGRSSSIIPSGMHIYRPKGQTKAAESAPTFGPSKRLDFELEIGAIIGQSNQLGDQVSTTDAADYVFGLVLLNDWSARDIQKWEYIPLGPFLGKSFASSISSWVITMEAIEFAKLEGPIQDPEVLPYLQYQGSQNYNINLSVGLAPQKAEETIISNSNFKYMYWNISQQVAHHTSNGCNLNVGDMLGSGTISGPTPDSLGSMLELSWAGSKEILLKDGIKRKFIEDYDTITIRGHAHNDEVRVGFGELQTTILPAK